MVQAAEDGSLHNLMSCAHFAEKRDLLSVRRPHRPGFPGVGLRQGSRNVTMNGLNPDRVRAITGAAPTECNLLSVRRESRPGLITGVSCEHSALQCHVEWLGPVARNLA